ncbi:MULTISPECIES: hypothetical protein [Methylococcus]|uniref:Lipoprotein n=1 Tax=Methylococcus capsulatus TaxID=414 RepID=A0ABZ2F7N9_METCP|nr:MULTISPECIES: hypothetical protein [Methylococcus]MDF9390928.1 hypothetical protein [Methylococcus capsulatus]
MHTKSHRSQLCCSSSPLIAEDAAALPRASGMLGHPLVRKVLPWLAGAGMGLGHAAVASNCTVPQQGRCSSCGSCIVVVGSLAVWALSRKKGQGAFYQESSR